MNPLSRIFLCSLLALSPMGCTLSRPLAHHAVSYNISVENAQNRMLLLNILRASERHPMYFTGISSIAAAPSYTLNSGDVSLTEEEGANTDLFKLPSGSYSNKPTMNIGVLDTQDFISGILSPVNFDVVNHYLRQGWRADVLAYLLVESIYTEDGVIRNDPGTDDFEKFRSLVHSELEGANCILENKTTSTTIRIDEETSLDELTTADEAGFRLEDLKKGIIAKIPKKTAIWSIHCTRWGREDFQAYIGQQNLERSRSVTKDDLPSALILRSPQGVLFYLGEILREIRAEGMNIPMVPYDGQYVPLFWATREDSSCAKSIVRVAYGGRTFHIPGDEIANPPNPPCTNRSMQTLALVSQLIALHKSAKSLPNTPLVRTVGD